MNADNTSRILLGLVEALNISPEEAEARLAKLTLRIVATPAVASSAAAQAGLLTAVNTGKRCFLGGVYIEGLDKPITLKVPFPPFTTLNEVVGHLLPEAIVGDTFTETIFVGDHAASTGLRDWVAYCAGWRGGVAIGRIPVAFASNPATDFALGGVYAGGLAVHHAFMRAAKLAHHLEEPNGISLWNLDAGWTDLSGDGPALDCLPTALWLIGLGHLGQAYLWTLALLPFPNPPACQLMLQDIDVLASANEGAALLSHRGDVNKRKTIICREWLEARGFTNSLICDRAFDARTVRVADAKRREPPIALCGLDNGPDRRHLESANFPFVLECGLGGFAADFDEINFHSFPNASRRPTDIWKASETDQASMKRQKMLEKAAGVCGAVPLSKVAISSSFVGAVSASYIVAELLRMYHGGKRCWDGEISLRAPQAEVFKLEAEPYDAIEVARLGAIELAP